MFIYVFLCVGILILCYCTCLICVKLCKQSAFCIIYSRCIMSLAINQTDFFLFLNVFGSQRAISLQNKNSKRVTYTEQVCMYVLAKAAHDQVCMYVLANVFAWDECCTCACSCALFACLILYLCMRICTYVCVCVCSCAFLVDAQCVCICV